MIHVTRRNFRKSIGWVGWKNPPLFVRVLFGLRLTYWHAGVKLALALTASFVLANSLIATGTALTLEATTSTESQRF